MTEAPPSGEPPASDPPPFSRRGRWQRGIASALLFLMLAVAGGLALLDSDIGHRFIADRIAAERPSNGLRYRVGRIDGSIYSGATLQDVRISDPKGEFFVAPRARLDWNPFDFLLVNRLSIDRLAIPRATLVRLPKTVRTGKRGPILPGFDIRVGRLSIDSLTLGPALTGTRRVGRLLGEADIRSGRARIVLAAIVPGSDRLRVALDAEPDRDRFDLAVTGQGAADGVLAKLVGQRRAVDLAIGGDGSWTRWAGNARLDLGGERIASLALTNSEGAYRASGRLALQSVTQGKLQRLTAPIVRIEGTAKLANRQLDGRVEARSSAAHLTVDGEVDLASSAFRDLRIALDLLRPPALFRNMTRQDVQLRAILHGAFDTARFDYRITARRFAFDRTGFEQVRAAGAGRLSPAPVTLPVRFTAQRVTGVGDVAGGILRNLTLEGPLSVTSRMVTGNGLRLSSDKLNGRVMLALDLKTGQYQVSLAGGLKRYLIPGLGIVDIESDLRVVPGAGGRGMQVAGRGTAQMIRLDNAFFRSLTQGLPRIEADLARGPDMILHFRNLRLTSPALRLTGEGYRRRDGTFHIEAKGTQRSYGPVMLVLDGRIERPTLDLRFTRPNETLGLRDVRAHLEPSAQGFDYRAEGGSRLGPFSLRGAILLPPGGQAAITLAPLSVSGAQASGRLDIVPGGFAGTLDVAGGGISGQLAFAPQGEHQQITGTLDAERAMLGGNIAVRRGHLEFTTLLDPAGAMIDAVATGQGLRSGALSLGQFAANIRMRGEEGTIRASVAGRRGRGFNLATETQLSEGRFVIRAQGKVDRRDLRFETPATIVRVEDGWRLEPMRLSFAGGEARVAGTLTGRTVAADVALERMPLAVLDIVQPDLALSGNASGSLQYRTGPGVAPTGRIDMTVRGLSRSGLVLSSRPIDIGIAGILQPDKAAVRAVMASEGKTIGRAQARVAPLGRGGLVERLRTAPLFAQLRYDGPADTLWRLTRIELFDLSGPVAIGADIDGTLRNPTIRGSLRTDGARIESAVTGTSLRNVRAAGRFSGSRLEIGSFTANDGKGGTLTGSGAFDFAATEGVGMALSLDADRVALVNRDGIGATVTGPLTIRSSGNGGTISGDVRLDRSRYRLGRATATSQLPVIATREINLPPGGTEDETPGRPWRLDLKARARDALMVSGLGLSSEWSADLAIRGEPTNPAITGRADLIRGEYEFAGREFDLERGVISFDGSVPANPSIDIAADANTEGLNATIHVTGTANRTQISFTSVPALPEEELLSRLLFGTSITNLSAPEAIQLAAAVAALQEGGDSLNPINQVRRAAGLDRLRILPADPQTGQGTSVAAGKYVTRNAYVEIVSDGQGYSATRVEFQITRWLSLLSSISTLGRQSANIRVSKDY